MATRAHTRSHGAYAPKVYLLLLISMIYLLAVPPGSTAFTAQGKGNLNWYGDTDRQRHQETWSAQTQRQDEVFTSDEVDFQRSREAWTARYQIQ